MSNADTYKGESDQKRFARLLFWLHLSPDTKDEKKLVLASREGGDIAVMRAGNIRPETIVAVDTCPDAIRECQAKHPGPQYIVGDAGDAAEREGPLCAALLDFCGPICDSTLTTAIRVARSVRPGGLFGVAVLRGRESGSTGGEQLMRAAGINRSWKRMLASGDVARKMRRNPSIRMALEMERMKAGLSTNRDVLNVARSSHEPGTARARMIQQALLTAGVVTTLIVTIDYQSIAGGSSGVPMTIATFVRGCNYHDPETIVGIPTRSSVLGSLRTIPVSKLRPNIRELALLCDTMAGLLNVSHGQLAAWKAVRTMGRHTPGKCFAPSKRFTGNERSGIRWLARLVAFEGNTVGRHAA